MFYSFLSRYFFLMPFWENVKYFIKHEREVHKYEHIFIINILLYNYEFFLMDSPGFPGDSVVACQCRRPGHDPRVRKIPWRRKWQPTLAFLPGNPLDRGGWWAIVCGVTRVGHDLATKLPPPCCYSGALWFGFHNSSLPTPPHRENL